MRSKQRGLGLLGLIATLVVIAMVVVFGMKVVPSYIEYRSAKSAIDEIAQSNPATPAQARELFDRHSDIDDITSIRPADLNIRTEGGQMVIGFAYRKEVPLGPHVGLYINYSASTRGSQ